MISLLLFTDNKTCKIRCYRRYKATLNDRVCITRLRKHMSKLTNTYGQTYKSYPATFICNMKGFLVYLMQYNLRQKQSNVK